MLLSLEVTAIDPSLGRMDRSTLSQQALMELLIDGIRYKRLFEENHKNYKDIAGWCGVTLSESGAVESICWGGMNLDGFLDWQWIPRTVVSFDATSTFVKGSLDVAALPEGLETLYLAQNRLCEAVDLTALPKKIKALNLSYNRLKGSVVLTSLPQQIEKLHAEGNFFTGTIDLELLPESLESLRLAANMLSGTLCFENIPRNCKIISLQENDFQGVVQVSLKDADRFVLIPNHYLTVKWID